jgi:hypothetical protein
MEKLPYLKIDNFYNENELQLIWDELKFLTHSHKLELPNKTGQIDPTMKHNNGLFLDSVYAERRFSNILKVNRKVFSANIMKQYADLHFMNTVIFNLNSDATLLSYYENAGYYKSHSDTAVITILTWLFKEPKQFEGGNLIFTDFKEEINIKNNTVIMFPSHTKHEVTAIKMESKNKFSGNGRYCISQFMSIK